MNYYNQIKNKLIDNKIYCKTKDYSKERNTVITYYEIGRLLSEAGSKYGESIIENYSRKLQIEVGKKYNGRTLRRIRQYYITFKDEKWSPLATTLSWSHYTELLPIKDKNKMFSFYSKEGKNQANIYPIIGNILSQDDIGAYCNENKLTNY